MASPYLSVWRRSFLVTCGQAAAKGLEDHPSKPVFSEDSLHLDAIVTRYGELREQFVSQHGMVGGLLANHKVAALYISILSRTPPEHLFTFTHETPIGERRLALAAMMNAVVLGVLQIDPATVNEALQDDLEYCLLKEPPSNLEWICFGMHALCRHLGRPTNIKNY
ncbi:hypothetical protein [Azospirillum rugosum]|nr:hypothetical protein [Azospirillum rugosum]MDQ0530483.1 hypothetical protein [Azospirillum rugosum]